MNINEVIKSGRSLMTVILTTLLISGVIHQISRIDLQISPRKDILYGRVSQLEDLYNFNTIS
jgi:hypothetical protein